MFKDQFRAIMQYSLPREGRPGDLPRILHDWICLKVGFVSIFFNFQTKQQVLSSPFHSKPRQTTIHFYSTRKWIFHLFSVWCSKFPTSRSVLQMRRSKNGIRNGGRIRRSQSESNQQYDRFSFHNLIQLNSVLHFEMCRTKKLAIVISNSS